MPSVCGEYLGTLFNTTINFEIVSPLSGTTDMNAFLKTIHNHDHMRDIKHNWSQAGNGIFYFYPFTEYVMG